MSEQVKSGIYVITNAITGDCYIGSSTDIDRRLTQHRILLRLGRHHSALFQAAWNEYGADAFVFDAVEIVQVDKDLLIREQYYLDERQPKYNPAKIATRNGTGVPRDKAPRGDHSASSTLWFVEWEDAMYEKLRLAYEDIKRPDDVLKVLSTNRTLTAIEQAVIVQHRSLASAAYEWGIKSGKDFLDFLDSGFLGMYDGETLEALRKGGQIREDWLIPNMGGLETALNWLRMEIAVKKLKEGQQGTPEEARQIHFEAGKAVRAFLTSEGIYPEQLPTPTKSYEQIVKEEAERIRIEEENECGLWSQLPPQDKGSL